ncbi:Modifier of rudimentary Modr protein [Nitzschia inconspicua]|uniref:Modifier of rudimentary Modr protein n=1 Tax=Nitzschia inconspicua TaxID=303405 RepID=A0A9K3L8L3_9STRA|nr:Modifier of rudimentary Modr protein [Nitzschia inconspicua]
MFSWSNGGTSSSTTTARASSYPGRRLGNVHTPVAGSIRPPSTNSEITRAQHLQSYLEDSTLQRSTRRVSSDDTTYDTVFQTTSGDTLILRVNVPLQSSFAEFCPAMTLAGVKVRHPWVDSSGRSMRITGYDPIQSEQSWKESRIKLGDAVHAVVKHLQLNPPQILEITDKGLQSIQQKKTNTNNGSRITATPPRNGMNGSRTVAQHANDAPPSYNIVAEATPAPEVPMPTIPIKFSELEGMSRQQLDDLMDDELEFMSLIYKLPVYDKIYTIGSSRLNENVQLAKGNLSHEKKLQELQNDVKSLHKKLQEKMKAFSVFEAKQNAICAPPDRADTLRKLNKAKKEALDQSEEMAEAWVEGDSGNNVDDFCKNFLDSRKVHHMRAAKMEILKNTPDRR